MIDTVVPDTDWAFAQYEHAREVMPAAAFPEASERVGNLGHLTERFDVFLLDAFGVLNVGETPISGAPERVAALQAAGKTVIVLTNGASLPVSITLAKYQKFGYRFTPENVISSRQILMANLARYPGIHWGAMALQASKLEQFPAKIDPLADDPALYDQVGGFILLGTAEWTQARQSLLIDSLRKTPRPVLVGNPDIVAPREDGFSLEAGWYAHELARATGIAADFSGKPYRDVFTEARTRFPKDARVLMVGDTLHTDILGGKAAGFSTLLIETHGLFKGKDVTGYIDRSGIRPDFIAPTT